MLMPIASRPLLLGAVAPLRAGESFGDAVYPVIAESLKFLGPELLVVLASLLLLAADLFVPRKHSRHLAWPALAACIVAAGMAAGGIGEEGRSIFFGMLAADSFAAFFKVFLLGGAAVAVLLSYGFAPLSGRRLGEYYFLLLTAAFGGMLMASSAHFLTMFLSLETLSVSSYVLVGYFRSDRKGAEAALKYVIYGAVAAAIMVYGFSLWFGMTGSASAASMAKLLAVPAAGAEGAGAAAATLTVLLAFLCILMGLAYKISAVPMHFWTPDVYEGAPTPVTAFLSVVSKGAGFALAVRLLGELALSIGSLPAGSAAAAFWEGLPSDLVLTVLSVVAVATMTLGNLAALWQTNLKRLMAYSAIAHAGYLVLGLILLRPDGVEPAVETISFYLAAYLTMNFGAFAVIILVENQSGSCDIEQYRGLGRRAPLLAVAFVIFLFSLIGIPPTAGFMGKFQLFLGVVGLGGNLEAAGNPRAWHCYVLVIIAVLNTAVSAYYYLRIAKAMYFEEPEPSVTVPGTAPDRGASAVLWGVIAVLVAATFYLCLQAGSLLETTRHLEMHP